MVAGFIHSHALEFTARCIRREHCPTCGRRTFFLIWFFEWYEPSSVCLRCGERWIGSEMSPRPFRRAWREESIEAVKRRWRRETAAEASGPLAASLDGGSVSGKRRHERET